MSFVHDHAPCPVCREPVKIDGPSGLLIHVMALHPRTWASAWIVGHLATNEAKSIATSAATAPAS